MDLISIFEVFFILGGLIGQVFLPGFPKETLLLQSGVSYGFVLGSIINWIGMVLGAQVGYEVVRKSVETGGRFTTILEDYQHSTFFDYVKNKGNRGLFGFRLVPTAPNDVLSLVAGGLLLPRKGFFIVSLITAVPYAILFAYLGSLGDQIIDIDLMFKVNFAVFIITVGIYIIRRRLVKTSIEQNTETRSSNRTE